MRPARRWRIVDFPEPEGPRRTAKSWSGILRLTVFMAVSICLGNFLVTFSSVIISSRRGYWG